MDAGAAQLAATLQTYHGLVGNDAALERISRMLEDALQDGGLACLVCLDDIKRTDALWTCSACYRSFHLQCIQQWVKDGVVRTTGLSDDLFPEQARPWHCPNCRHEYRREEAPRKYFCYCGKVQDPPFNPWIAPHACGEVCGRALQPACGHSCVLLCHPGPCPPCPQLLKAAPCYCGKTRTARRCADAHFSCGEACGKRLACGVHTCADACHSGSCGPCPHTSRQRCQCGKEQREVACSAPAWQCEQPCGKPLGCGQHTCSKICHQGPCGDCPRQGPRRCPCGKTEALLSCVEDVPCCGDTCDKMLPCGRHRCTQRCHVGACEKCSMAVDRRCRCGAVLRSTVCGTEFLCDKRCNRMRNCGRHHCRRRCCDGKCPPCEEICGQKLSCKNHTCASPCHTGPCYSCSVTVPVACRCGATVTQVPCGREKVAQPPRCRQPCREAPYCRHSTQAPHNCHQGPCPDCKLPCEQDLPCGHVCGQPCHDERPVTETVVLTKTAKQKLKDGEVPVVVHKRPTPCPPCNTMVRRACVGAHVVRALRCPNNARFSCRQPCGRMLTCGRHVCAEECHLPNATSKSWREVDNDLRAAHGREAAPHPCAESEVYLTVESLTNDAASIVGESQACGACQETCMQARPEKCTHKCPRRCHTGVCEPCQQPVALTCFCGLSTTELPCHIWAALSDEDVREKRRCGQRCRGSLPCGHRCDLVCHEGACGDVQRCTKKVLVRCPCKARKQDYVCHVLEELRKTDPQAGVLTCGSECKSSSSGVTPNPRSTTESTSASVPATPLPVSQTATVPAPKEALGQTSKQSTLPTVSNTNMIVAAVVAVVVAVLAAVWLRG